MNRDLPNTLADDLVRARNGDMQAFAALVRAHQRAVYSLGLRMLGSSHLAEDLAQEVFIQCHGNLQSFESVDHLAFWLRRVTTHRAIDQLRRDSRSETTSLDEAMHVSSSVEPRDILLQRRLQALILKLNPDARAVMMLRYQEDLDPAEIARTLDMPINTVKSHLKRSLDAMRRDMT